MSKCQTDRRKKEKRRKGYKTALETKCSMLQTKADNAMKRMDKAVEAMQVAIRRTSEAEEQASKADAVSLGILQNRLFILYREEKMEGRIGVRYEQQHDRLHLRNLREFTRSLLEQGPPVYRDPHEEFVEIPPFTQGVEQRINMLASRGKEHLMRMVEQCVDHLGKLIAHQVFRKMVENLK